MRCQSHTLIRIFESHVKDWKITYDNVISWGSHVRDHYDFMNSHSLIPVSVDDYQRQITLQHTIEITFANNRFDINTLIAWKQHPMDASSRI